MTGISIRIVKLQTIENIIDRAGVKQLISAFDLLPDVLFWVKDTQSRILYANKHFIEHQGYKSVDQIVLKTDLDFSPKHLAFQYINDDKRVMNGYDVTDRLELNQTNKGELAWFSTSKKALFTEGGIIQGTYGVTRHLQKSSKALLHVRVIEEPVNYIRNIKITRSIGFRKNFKSNRLPIWIDACLYWVPNDKRSKVSNCTRRAWEYS